AAALGRAGPDRLRRRSRGLGRELAGPQHLDGVLAGHLATGLALPDDEPAAGLLAALPRGAAEGARVLDDLPAAARGRARAERLAGALLRVRLAGRDEGARLLDRDVLAGAAGPLPDDVPAARLGAAL